MLQEQVLLNQVRCWLARGKRDAARQGLSGFTGDSPLGRTLAAGLWAEAGELTEAARLAPDTSPPGRQAQKAFYLLQALLHPEQAEKHLARAAAAHVHQGHIAYHAVKLLGPEPAEPFVREAEATDPESHWTALARG